MVAIAMPRRDINVRRIHAMHPFPRAMVELVIVPTACHVIPPANRYATQPLQSVVDHHAMMMAMYSQQQRAWQTLAMSLRRPMVNLVTVLTRWELKLLANRHATWATQSVVYRLAALMERRSHQQLAR
jgi:hypothetical protein